MKTSELSGAALDWAVGTALKLPDPYWSGGKCVAFSTDWAQGGPIIEREKIELEHDGHQWWARIRADEDFNAPTPLIAAMRCYVASKLGDEVDIPNELQGEKQ